MLIEQVTKKKRKSAAATPVDSDDFDDLVVQAKALVNLFQIY